MHQHQERRGSRANALRVWLYALLFLLAAGDALAQATCTWNVNGPGTWGSPSNWNDCGSGNGTPAGTPGPADHAVIGNIAPNADIDLGADARVVDRMTLSAGRLSGNADLTVSTQLIWTGGSIDGSTQVPTSLNLALAGSADLSGGLKVLQRRDFINLGTVTWVDGDIELREDAEIDNQGVIVIDVTGGVRGPPAFVRLQTDGSPQARLHNSANPGVRIDKSGGGVVEFAPALQFDNGNAVNVSEGVLAVRGPGSDFGNYNVNSPGALHFGPPNGVTRELTGATAVSGSGLLHKFDEGQLTISGGYTLSGPLEVIDGVLYFDTPADPLNLPTVLVQSPGVLTGLDNLAVTSALVWNGGDIVGASPGVNLTLGAAASGLVALDPLRPTANLNSRNLINQGTLTVSASGSALTQFAVEAANIDNQGLLELNSTSSQNLMLDCLTTDACNFDNQPGATVRMTDQAGGVVIIGQEFAAFDNDGLVELTQGCGAIGAPGTDTSGTYRYAGSCTLLLAPRPDFERVLASTVVLDQQGGTSLQVGGRLVFNGASRSFGSLILDPFGTLAGTADFVFTEFLIWRGEIEGSVITQGMTISAGAVAATSAEPADTPVLALRTLTIDGELNLSEVKLNLFDAAINNAGILNLVATPAAGGGILCPSPPTCGTVTNQAGGALQSLALPGGPTNEIGTDVAIVNQGTLQIDSGVLILEGPYSAAAGSVLDIGLGAGLRRTVGNLVLAAGTLRGAGVIDADLDLDAVVVEPGGALTGSLGVLGDFAASASTSFQMGVEGAAPPAAPAIGDPGRGAPSSSYDRLAIAGIATLAGTLDVIDLGYTPAPTDFFDLLTYASAGGSVVSGANPYSGLGFVLQTQATRVRLAQPGAGTSCTWNPGGAGADDWTNPAKWSGCSTGTGPGPGPVGTPGAGDTAIVGSGVVNLDVPVSVNELQLTGGTIQGPSNLAITGSLVWTGGSFLGTSVQSVTVDLAAIATISGGQHTLNGRNFVLDGIATWTTGLIELANGATFRINPTGQLTANPSLNFESFFGSGAGTSQIDNDGAIIKLGGNSAGIASSLEYGGSGSITVTAGTFIVAAGSPGSLDSSYTADVGAALHFVNGNRNFGATANLGGAGTLVFGDGGPQVSVNTIAGCIANDSNVAIRHAQVAINCPSPTLLRTLLMVDADAILEGSSSIEINLDLVWGHGLIRGTGAAQQFKLLAGATGSLPSPLGAGFARVLDARTFTNHGDLGWFGENALAVNNGAVFDNQTDGQLTLGGGSGTRNLVSDQAGSPLFFNRGALQLINSTSADFDLGLGNTGTVNLISGTLRLRRNSTDTGSYAITGGSLLAFDGAGVTLTATSSVSGAGDLEVVNGATVTVNGGFAPGGLLVASGGTIAFETGGVVNLADVALDGGNLGGFDEVRVGSQMFWDGGSVVGAGASPGALVILPGATLDMDAPTRILDSRVLRIAGGANWFGGALRVPQNQAAKVDIPAGGTLSIQTVKSIGRYGCVATPCTAELELGGGLVQVGDGAEFELSSPLLMSSGLLRAQGSPLTVNPGIQVSGGVVQVDLNSELATPVLTLDGGFLRGQGDITGNVVNNAGRVQPGSSPGDLGIIGNYTQGPGGALDIQVGGLTPGVQSDHVTVSGSATLDGTLDASIVGYTLTNPDVLEILSAGGGVLGSFSTSNIAHPGYAAVYGANAVTLEPTGTLPLVVNSIDDVADGSCDATHCSLREALLQANLMPDPDSIQFNIPAPQCTGPASSCVIAPASALPAIATPVHIDGYTQPGAVANTFAPGTGLGSNAALRVAISGVAAGGATCLALNSANALVRIEGLAIHDCAEPIHTQSVPAGTAQYQIVGNFLGLRADGSAGAGGNLRLRGGTVIFGDATAAGMNVCGGLFAIEIDNPGDGLQGVLMRGNLIGLAPDGLTPRPQQFGLAVGASTSQLLLQIGGLAPDERNVISANNLDGINFFCQLASTGCFDGSGVIGNYIGVAADGVTARGNGRDGILVDQMANGRLYIGDTMAGSGNRIAFNTRQGVTLAPGAGGRVSVIRNSIFSNGQLGIDIDGNGRTANDPGDGDTGSNGLQNFPAFTSYSAPGGTSAVIDVLVDTPDVGGNYPVRVDFYKAAGDEPGIWLGTTTCSTPNVSCPASFVFPGGVSVAPDDVVLGVVTDATGKSSEASFYASTTTITADTPDPSTVGMPYTVSVEVASVAPNPFAPLGGVLVSDGVGNTCPVTLAITGPGVSGGSCQLPSVAPAALTLGASYAPGSSRPFTSSADTEAHVVDAGNIATNTTITSVLPAAVVTGQSYTVSVLVEALIPRGTIVTTGTVIVRQLSDNSSCSIDLASASSCSLSSAVALNTAVRAFYQGSGSLDPSSSAAQAISVGRADTTIAIVEDSPDPSGVNQPVTVRVSLAVTAPGAGMPTGDVLITDGTASCGITLPNLSCTLLPKAIGQATIEARYLGDANYNSSTDTEAHTISADGADLSIVKRNGLRLLPGGQPSTYVLLVSNAGPQSVVNARVTDILPAQFSAASWTCSAAAGSSCPASGSGNVDALVSIGAGSSVSFALTATAQATPEQVVTNTATVVPPANAPDPALGNNSSTDVDPIGVFGEGFESENE